MPILLNPEKNFILQGRINLRAYLHKLLVSYHWVKIKSIDINNHYINEFRKTQTLS